MALHKGYRLRLVIPDKMSQEKIFHLRAEPVAHQIAPGLDVAAWGYNGSTPGPLLEATEGDRVRIYVTNRLDGITL